MPAQLSRNYDTDFSRTDVHHLLENMAHELADARGLDLPTQNAFETPELRHGYDESTGRLYRENEFEVKLLPTVSEDGVEPEHLIPSECVHRGQYYVRLLGTVAASDDAPAVAHVTVRKARSGDARNLKGETTTFEDTVAAIARRHGGEANNSK